MRTTIKGSCIASFVEVHIISVVDKISVFSEL